ncbi:MAG: hypothetical protein WBA22_14750 [Candidatus Methanofastidiosia archaeon]
MVPRETRILSPRIEIQLIGLKDAYATADLSGVRASSREVYVSMGCGLIF